MQRTFQFILSCFESKNSTGELHNRVFSQFFIILMSFCFALYNHDKYFWKVGNISMLRNTKIHQMQTEIPIICTVDGLKQFNLGTSPPLPSWRVRCCLTSRKQLEKLENQQNLRKLPRSKRQVREKGEEGDRQ